MNHHVPNQSLSSRFTGNLLSGFSLREVNKPNHGLSSTLRSLAYQAQKMGIDYHQYVQDDQVLTESMLTEPEHNAALIFSGPDIDPIHCTISGWPDGDVKAFSENAIQAASGMMSIHGRFSGELAPFGIDYISTITACLALQGAMASAIAQLNGQRITHCSTSMANSALLSIGQYLAGATAEEDAETILPEKKPESSCLPFISADGIAFEIETLSPKPWQAFWLHFSADSKLIDQGWQAFVLRYARAIAPIPKKLSILISRHTLAEIETIASQTNVHLCPVNSFHDLTTEHQANLEQGPWQFSAPTQYDISHHNGNPSQQATTKDAVSPLRGLSVIESCRRIQGPLSGHMLQLLGANVTRIEPIGGDNLRGMPPMANGCSARFDALNQHKKICEIDIKSSNGQQAVHDLAKCADVFLHNWAPGKAAQLNLDRANLLAQNSALIYAYAGGWGNKTQELTIPGTDFMAQAYSGVADIIGKTSSKSGGSLFTILDILGGIISAQAITAALLHRQLYRTSHRVDTSLWDASSLLLLSQIRLTNQDSVQHLPLQGVFKTQSGSIYLECQTPDELSRVINLIGCHAVENVELLSQQELTETLQQQFLLKPAVNWLEQFSSTNMVCEQVIEDLTDILNEKRFQPYLNNHAYAQVKSPWRFIS